MVRLTHQICSLILMAVVLPINAQDVDWVITSPNEAYDYSQVDITFASANTIAQVQLTGDEGGLTLVSFQDNAIKLLTPIVFQDTVFAYALTITDSANNTATFEKTMLVKIYEHPLDAFKKLSTIYTENFSTDDYAVFNFSFDAIHTAELYTETSCYNDVCSDQDGYFGSDLHNGMWGDFNGDGHEDFVATWAVFPSGLERDGTSTLSNIEIYLNNGEGRLIRNRDIYVDGVPPSSHNLYRIAVADFNKDGIDDIFSVAMPLIKKGVDGETVKSFVYPHALLLSTPEGKFRDASSDIEGNTQAPCSTRDDACNLWSGHNSASGDINGDGYPDLSIGHKLFLNETGEKFVDVTDQLPSEWKNTNIYTGPMTTEIKDFNDDGFGDLVMFWFDMAHLDDPPDPEILLSNGTANISEWTRHYLPIGYFGDGLTKFNNKFSGDIDGDGDLDMVTNTTRTNPYYHGRFIQVLINDGNGNFTDNSFEALGEQPRAGDYSDPDYTHFCDAHGEGSIFLRDYDGDGDLDIIDVGPGGTSPTSCASPSIFLNNGTGVFSELQIDLAWVQGPQVDGWEVWLDSGAHRAPSGRRMVKAYPLNLDNKNKLDFVSSWQVPAQDASVPRVDNIIRIYQVMSVGDMADTDDDGVPDVYISGGNRTIADTDGIAGESVSFTGTATDSDGTIATTQWLVGGSVVATGLTPSIALSNGSTVVTFKATDNAGASSTTTVTITVEPHQRNILISIYNAANGSGWTNNTGWNGAVGSECDWYGVTCTSGQITTLSLGSNNLSGKLSTELGNLTKLTVLGLNNNQLSGSIPSELGNLTSLTTLYLYDNQLTGSIPTELGKLASLTTIDLGHNQLTGSIPSELGDLTSLIKLYLYNNQLTGSIPAELGNLTSLTRINSSNNSLTGSIPTELGNLTSLTSLDLSRNSLTGPLPEWLSDMAISTLNTTDAFTAFPVVAISGGNRTIADTDGIAGESVSFTGTATDSDGTIATTQWLVGGSVVATGLTATIALPNGSTVVTFKATDNDGASSTTTTTITITASAYTVTDEWPSPYNGVTPDSSLGLAFNNIGVFSASDSIIYTCLRIFTDGLPGSAGGISEFDIGLTVVSLDEATVQITQYREFNTIGALNENVELPDCSGKFETTTSVYTDIIEAGDSVLDTTWSLIDPTNLILKLSSYQELTAN